MEEAIAVEAAGLENANIEINAVEAAGLENEAIAPQGLSYTCMADGRSEEHTSELQSQ